MELRNHDIRTILLRNTVLRRLSNDATSNKFNFPVDDEIKVTDTAKEFIKSFIARRTKRVGRGGPDDISDITGHKFFKGVDWNFDTIRNYDPPFPVELKNPKDTVRSKVCWSPKSEILGFLFVFFREFEL